MLRLGPDLFSALDREQVDELAIEKLVAASGPFVRQVANVRCWFLISSSFLSYLLIIRSRIDWFIHSFLCLFVSCYFTVVSMLTPFVVLRVHSPFSAFSFSYYHTHAHWSNAVEERKSTPRMTQRSRCFATRIPLTCLSRVWRRWLLLFNVATFLRWLRCFAMVLLLIAQPLRLFMRCVFLYFKSCVCAFFGYSLLLLIVVIAPYWHTGRTVV